MSNFFFPKLLTVKALKPYRLLTTWNTGEELEVDVEPILRKNEALHPILNPEVFIQVRMDDWGSVEWLDAEFAADNVYAWSKEQAGQVSHEMFNGWMLRNNLSLTTAAQALGISRRMVSYYRTAQKPIPRQTWLACLGWETTRPKPTELPLGLPTAQQYAALHA